MDSDGSDEFVRPAALPVDFSAVEDIDFSVPPANGIEYLQRVMVEAKKCKKVVVAKLNPSLHRQNSSATLEEPEHISPLAPDAEWQEVQVSNFSRLRLRVESLKQGLRRPKYRAELPLITDCEGWKTFCFGSGCSDRLAVDDSNGTPPLLSILTNIGQPMVDQLLDWHGQWLQERQRLSHPQGRWVFALLACLELPLHPDTCSVTRSIARTCRQIRNSMEDPDPCELAAVNLLICLVGRYFGQSDLAD